MAFSKVTLNGVTLMDVTGDTVSASNTLDGVLAHNNAGVQVEGTIANGSATTPATTITANPSISVSSSGLITATASATKSITPTVVSGMVSSGTAGTVTVSGSNTQQLTTQGAQTITPSTSNQTIASGKYLTGNQTISGDSNLVASNIKKGVSIFNVAGSYEGSGGGSKNVQVAQSTTRATSTSYTEVISLTCTKTGTYDVYWSTFRTSTSNTWGSQLYIDDTAYGSAITGSWSNHIQNNHLSNVSITANQEVAVRVRSRGSNYYGYVGTLTIIES